MKKKIFFLLLTPLILVLFSCCGGNQEIVILSHKNPTEYTFNFCTDSIRKIVIQNFNNKQFYGLSLANNERVLLHDIFKDSLNINDFVLEEFSTWHKCNSKVYFNKKNEPHIYHATYQIHLEKINENKTKVSIITSETGIIYKSKLPALPHFNRVNKLKVLPATTVEEYEILLIIGKALGVKDMPSLKIPDKVII